MFKDSKKDKKKSKLMAKYNKEAQKELERLKIKKRNAEKIKDKAYVEQQLEIQRRNEQKKKEKIKAALEKEKERALDEDMDTFECAGCHMRISISNLNCPHCGQLHCKHCGHPLPMGADFDGKCPKCEGFQYYQPAELVVTKVEDIPEHERFWEGNPECPKCGATVQSDWDDCPFCGQVLGGAPKAKGREVESAADQMEGEPEAPKKVKKRLRRDKKKEASGV